MVCCSSLAAPLKDASYIANRTLWTSRRSLGTASTPKTSVRGRDRRVVRHHKQPREHQHPRYLLEQAIRVPLLRRRFIIFALAARAQHAGHACTNKVTHRRSPRARALHTSGGPYTVHHAVVPPPRVSSWPQPPWTSPAPFGIRPTQFLAKV